MDPKRHKAALEFMFNESKFPNAKWWLPNALTMAGNAAGNPPGNIQQAEAESIFHDLKKKELLLPFINSANQACYILNECKEAEWHDEIEDAGRPFWSKRRRWKTVGKVLLWVVAAFLAGYIGAMAKIAAEKQATTTTPSSRLESK